MNGKVCSERAAVRCLIPGTVSLELVLASELEKVIKGCASVSLGGESFDRL